MAQDSVGMLDRKVAERLRELGRQIKSLFPHHNGNVQFNIGKAQPEPVVNLNLADVTEVKK